MKDKVLIMVVDDDPNIAHLVKLYLEKEGYAVSVKTRGDEAVQGFRTENPDLVLLDVMLPGLDGWDVCRQIRKQIEHISHDFIICRIEELCTGSHIHCAYKAVGCIHDRSPRLF